MTTELIDTSSDAGTPGSSIASKLVPPHVTRSTLSIQLVPPGKDNDPDEGMHTYTIHYDYNNPNILQQCSRRERPVHASYTINVADLDIALDESKEGAAVLTVLVRSDTMRQLKYPIGYPEIQAYCMIQGDKSRCTLPGSLPADTKLKILMVNGHRMTGSLREVRRVVSNLLEIKENHCMHMNTEE